MRDCVFRIVEASKGADGERLLSEKQARELLDEIQNVAVKKTSDGMDISDAIAAEIAAMKVNKKIQGQIQRRNAAINIIKSKEARDKINQFVSEGLDGRKAFQAMLVGVQGAFKEGRYSIDAKYKAIHGKYTGDLVAQLEKQDLLPIMRQRGMQEEIERELWALQDGKGGVTKSKEALQIAKIIHRTNEALRLRQNRAGAYIDKLEGFTVSQTHDRITMRKQGYEKWRNSILPLLDKERTFKGEDAEEFLKSTYEVLTTGISRKVQQDDKLFEFKGAANLAKRISKSRVLHFKDADSSIAYRNEYGKRDFTEGVLLGIDGASRNIALMETLGTNPRAMFDKLLSDFKKDNRSNTKIVDSLIDEQWVRHFFDEVEGANLVPESPTLASIGSSLRAIQSMSKLGGALISSISDISLKASELRFQGFGYIDSYIRPFRDIQLSTKDKRELGAMLRTGFDGMLGNITARFNATDELVGKMSKLQRLFFKLNGLEWWTDSQKRGTAFAMSNRLARIKDKNFDSLDVDTKRLFNNFGINNKDWDNIRISAVKMMDGDEYITPDAIRNLVNLSDKEKEILEDKLTAYFIDRVDTATISPDARERAILAFGTRRGTIMGEFARFIAQFKAFPTSVITKVWGRALHGKGKADIPAIIQLAITTTMMGYMAMAGKDLLKGREPRPLDDANTWKAAFLQGGGAGIYGDLLLGEYNRFGNDLLQTAAGPVLGMANDFAAVASAAAHGDDAAAKFINTTINNMPFANLFYTRPALNYMFMYQLQEAVNPGYLRRMERRVAKENKQKFLIKPSDIAR